MKQRLIAEPAHHWSTISDIPNYWSSTSVRALVGHGLTKAELVTDVTEQVFRLRLWRLFTGFGEKKILQGRRPCANRDKCQPSEGQAQIFVFFWEGSDKVRCRFRTDHQGSKGKGICRGCSSAQLVRLALAEVSLSLAEVLSLYLRVRRLSTGVFSLEPT